MMSRHRFMARTSAAIDELVKQLPLEPSERADAQARMARYNRECGCAMGGVFMVAALLVVLVYIAVTASFAIGFVAAGIAFVVACSLVGKAVGLALASVQLELLQRSLARRARREEGKGHVYLH